jgi:toxin ParE1/3/4
VASHYAAEADENVVEGFLAAVEHALDHVSHHPASGSLRYAHKTGVDGLRAWPMKRYPYVLLYIEQEDCVDVLRVLHDKRDIPSSMQEPDKP